MKTEAKSPQWPVTLSMKIIFICLYSQGLINNNASAYTVFCYIQIECEIQADIINGFLTCLH